jgi:hypothetical protein
MVHSSQKDGLLKVGILDMKGQSYISAGSKVDLLVLEIREADGEELKIAQAVLADRNGLVVPVKIITEEEAEGLHPESFSLFQNYPNPFNPQTQINYALPQACHVRVTIYNLLGQRVRVLVDEHQNAGFRRIGWDGKDEQGVEAASGVYFYRLETGGFIETKKMLLLR